MITKKIGVGIFLLLTTLLFLPLTKAFASEATFSFYPSSGVVKDTKEGFTVDVLINSGGFDITKARMVVKFDPTVIQLSNAYRNNTLFASYPEDQSSTDNVDGVVMLTGITTADDDISFYKTVGDSDVFTRLEFTILDESVEEIVLDYEYSGEDIMFKSVIMRAGEPSTNVLLSKPQSVTFFISEEDVPETSISSDRIGIIVGVLLILIGGFVRSSSIGSLSRKSGTIVLGKESNY